MNLLIHAHPQFSYVCRSIVEVSQLNNLNLEKINVCLANGPGFLNHMLPSFRDYIKKYRPFSSIVNSTEILDYPIHIDPQNFFSCDFPPPILEFLNVNHSDLFNNLTNSVHDSLFRGLSHEFNHFNYHLDQHSISNQDLFRKRLNYAGLLIDYYLNIINMKQITHTVCSHGYYDFHVAFTIASIISGCKSYIVAGGNRNSYEIKSKAIVDFGSEAPFQEIVNKKSFMSLNSDCQPDESSRIGQKNSLISIFRQNNVFSENPHPISLGINASPFIVLPVFSEVNFHLNSNNNLYDSRFSWFEETILYLSKNTGLPIYIRRHPDSEEYGESKFVDHIIDNVCRNNKSIIELKSLEDVSIAINNENSSGRFLLPIMFGNSFALEISQIGYPSIVVTDCSATSINGAALLPASIDEYYSILSNSHTIKFCRDTFSMKKAVLLMSLMKKTIGNKAVDRWARKEYDEYYFFGTYNKIDSGELLLTMQKHIQLTKFQCLDSKSFSTIIPEFR